MLTIDINPVLLHLGKIRITYYAVNYFGAFIVALIVLLRAIQKREINLAEEQAHDIIFFSLIGTLIGARIFHVIFWGLDYYLSEPTKIFYIWQGGLSFHGGLLGAFIAVRIYARKNNIPFWRLSDLFVLPILFFLATSRIANFINQEIVGTITNVPWCVNFNYGEGCRHPVQLYAAAGKFVLLGIILVIKNSLKKYKPGFIFWTFVTLISFGRFALDFIREDPRFLALSAGQWLSIPLIVGGTYILLRHYKQELKTL